MVIINGINNINEYPLIKPIATNIETNRFKIVNITAKNTFCFGLSFLTVSILMYAPLTG